MRSWDRHNRNTWFKEKIMRKNPATGHRGDRRPLLQPIVLTPTEAAFVGGGDGPDGGALPPACECHTDRNNNLVCTDANGRKCG